MKTTKTVTTVGFSVGQLIVHNRYGYRGVIVDVDPVFQGSKEWYNSVARSRPPKKKPWYHVLVHDSLNMTYVAEKHLMADVSEEPIINPLLEMYFVRQEHGRYISEILLN